VKQLGLTPLHHPFIPPSSWLVKKTIHEHTGSFADLATQRLPELQRMLESQIANPLPLSLFTSAKTGPATLSAHSQIQTHLKVVSEAYAAAKEHTAKLRLEAGKRLTPHEFAGVYVFVSSDRPFYIGITRTIYRRVQAHIRHRNHNAASLLFNMVREDAQHKGLRGELDFNSERASLIQAWLQSQSVAILPLACPVERYAFELYAAMVLKTGVWNTFETH
jgi:hypothetical protein